MAYQRNRMYPTIRGFLSLRNRRRLQAKSLASRAKREAQTASSSSRQPMFEPFEPRILLSGSIAGTVWADLNADGIHDANEPGMAGITVYLDDNDNAELDWVDGNANSVWDDGEGERWVISATDNLTTAEINESGNYEFDTLPAGSYRINLDLPSNHYMTNGTLREWDQYQFVTKLLATNDTRRLDFGRDVSIDGNKIAVGASGILGADVINNGMVFLYEQQNQTWDLSALLTPTADEETREYGRSVTISGDVIAIGEGTRFRSPAPDSSVFVYDSPWSTGDDFSQLIAGNDDWFGNTLDVDNNRMIIGASIAEKAFIYERVDGVWTEAATLISPASGTDDQFGQGVAISGDFAVVTATADGVLAENAGAAYVYRRVDGSWTSLGRIDNPQPAISDGFGFAVDIENDQLIVGAYIDDSHAFNGGVVFTYRWNGFEWISQQTLLPSDLITPHQLFGFSVELKDDYLIVGARGSETAYVFRYINDSWQLQTQLVAPDSSALDFFGHAVSISGQYAVVSAINDDDSGENLGSAYLFEATGQSEGTWIELAEDEIVADAALGFTREASAKPDLLSNSDSGFYDDDNLTNRDNANASRTLDFTIGNTVAGDTISIYADDIADGVTDPVLIGQAVAAGETTSVTTNGTFDLTDGEWNITATVTVPDLGEFAPSDALRITIDTTSPYDVWIDALTTTDTRPPLTGTISDPTAIVSVTLDGQSYYQANNHGDGTWSLADNFLPELAPGTYTPYVRATDPAGNSYEVGRIDGLVIALMPTFTISDAQVVEGDSGTAQMVFTVSLDNPAIDTIRLDWHPSQDLSADGAMPNVDYQATVGGSLIWFEGQQQSYDVSVDVYGDTAFESDETFFLDIFRDPEYGNGTFEIADSRGVGTILNDDLAPAPPTFSINNSIGLEGTGGTTDFVFTITPSGPAIDTVRVDWSLFDLPEFEQSAILGVDMPNQTGNVVWFAGQSQPIDITVSVNADSDIELHEFIYARIEVTSGSGTEYRSEGFALIFNDDSDGDPYEPNDTLATAFDLTPYEFEYMSDHLGLAQQNGATDEDWYRINITRENQVFEAGIYDYWVTTGLVLEMFDDQGQPIANEGGPSDSYVRATLDEPQAIYLRVSGGLDMLTYNLIWGDTTLGSIGNFVWNDENENGLQDLDESGIADVEVLLLDDDGLPIDQTTTDADGHYEFVVPENGTYQIQVLAPAGYIFTERYVGNASFLDSDFDEQGRSDSIIGNTLSFNDTIDAGLIYRPATITAMSFNDENGNGVRDVDENAPTVQPTVYLDLNANGIYDEADTIGRYTASGTHGFTSLAAGTYIVRQQTPEGYQPTTPLDNDYRLFFFARENGVSAYDETGTHYYDIEFPAIDIPESYVRDMIIGPNDWLYAIHGTFDPILEVVNPLTGEVISSLVIPGWDNTNNGTYGGITATDRYVFVADSYNTGNSPSGIIRIDMQASDPAASAVHFGRDEPFDFYAEYIDLAMGQDGNLYALAGNGRTVRIFDPETLTELTPITLSQSVRAIAIDAAGVIFGASLGGTVWRFDATGQATHSINPAQLNELGDIDITTDGQLLVAGGYSDPAAILTSFVDGAFTTPTLINHGLDNGFITAFGAVWDMTLDGYLVNVEPGDNVGPYYFGQQEIPVVDPNNAEIHGTQWADLNADGDRDAGEPGLAGWMIYLDLNSNGQLDDGEPTQITDSNGAYAFTGLASGDYIVAQVLQDGWYQTAPGSSGELGGVAPGAALLALPPITTTGSDAPVYALGLSVDDQEDDDSLTGQTVESAPLINLDDLRNDARFAGIDGTGQTVVILDTGIDLDHPFFGPDLNNDGIADRIVHNYDFNANDSIAQDGSGHGSNVAGIIGSQDSTYTGIAPGVDIIALQVLNSSGSGSFTALENALQWIVTNATAYNITAINMSLGDTANYTSDQELYGLNDELAALHALGVIIVSAAGNAFYGFGSQQGVSYPAADASSLAVGAVYDASIGGVTYSSGAVAYSTGVDRIAPFSQRHTTLTEIFAPGAAITNANHAGSTVTQHGTSQAAPHIAGIAALAQQLAEQHLGRRLTQAEFVTLMQDTATDVYDGDDENDNVTNTNQNYPRVDVYAMAEAILDMATPVAPDGTHVVSLDASEIVDGIDFGGARPIPDAPDLAATSDTGTSDTDNTTNRDNQDESATLDFIVNNTQPGDRVAIYADLFDTAYNPILIGQAIATGTTTTITTDPFYGLTDGSWDITAGITVAGVGQFAPSEALRITIDTTAPTASVDPLTTTDTTPALTGTIDDPAATLVVTVDGNDYTPTIDGNQWSIADGVIAALTAGQTYNVIVTATDIAGNVGIDYTTDELTIEPQPTGSIFVPLINDLNGNGLWDLGEPALNGWQAYLDLNRNGLLDIDEPTMTTSLNDGIYFYDLTPDTYRLAVIPMTGWDKTAPVTTSPLLSQEIVVAAGTPTQAEPFLFQQQQTAAPTGLSLYPGYDTGLSSTDQITQLNNHDLASQLGFVFYPVSNFATVNLYADGLLIGQARITPAAYINTVITDGTTVLADGIHAFTVTATLPGELESEHSEPVIVTIDTVAPTTTVDPLTTTDTTPLLTGTVDDPEATISVVIIGVGLITEVDAVNLGDGTWQAQTDETNLLFAGYPHPFNVIVTATDIAGNVGTDDTTDELVIENPVSTDSSISGVVFGDWNGDGVQDGDEPALAGVVVYLDENDNALFDDGEMSVISDATGFYEFTALVAGDYVVRQVVPAGYDQTLPVGSGPIDPEPPVGGDPVTIDPDAFSDNALLNSAFDNVALRALGSDLSNDRVLAEDDGRASTGDFIFRNHVRDDWGSTRRYLRADFDTEIGDAGGVGGVATVSLDFIAANGGDSNPELVAYDSDGQVIDSVLLAEHFADGVVTTLTVESTDADRPIAYVLAYWDRNGFARSLLDHMVYTPFGEGDGGDGGGDTGDDGAYRITLADDVIISDLDFGNDPQPSSIAGIIYDDQNYDGDHDAGEPGLSGVLVWLDLNDDNVVDGGEPQVTTGADGSYLFTDLNPNDYVVRVQKPAMYHSINPTSNDQSTTLGAAEDAGGFDFGFYPSITLTPHAFSLHAPTDTGLADNDNITRFNNNDSATRLGFSIIGNPYPSPSGTIHRFYANGTLIAVGPYNQITYTDGVTTLADGQYQITATHQFPDSFESAHSYPLAITIDTSAPTGRVNSLTTLDDTPPLSGTVSEDVVDIQLTVNGQTVAVTHDGSGNWQLADDVLNPLPQGIYDVQLALTDIAGNVGADTTINELAIGFETPVGGTLAGTIFQDNDADGEHDAGEPTLADVLVYLDANDNQAFDDGELNVLTDATGYYEFVGLTAGDYIVRQVVPTYYDQTTPANIPPVSSGDPVTVDPDAYGDNTLINHAYSDVTLAALGSDLRNDRVIAEDHHTTSTGGNIFRNHVRDDWGSTRRYFRADFSTVVASVSLDFVGGNGGDSKPELIAFDASGNIIDTMLLDEFVGQGVIKTLTVESTDPNTPIAYVLAYWDRNGFARSYLDHLVYAPFTEGDGPSLQDGSHRVSIIGDEALTDLNFGNDPQPASIAGIVYNDINEDGDQDAGEPGLAGIAVYLDLNNNGVHDGGEPSQSTSSDGSYLFNDLLPGAYVLREVLPEDHVATAPGDDGHHVDLEAGESATGYNFGNIPPEVEPPTGGDPVVVDPDAFSDNTLLNHAYPDVTLRALGSELRNDRVIAEDNNVTSTGANVFRNHVRDDWGGTDRYLRADFAVAVSAVSLDFIAGNGGTANPELVAYDANGQVIDTQIQNVTVASGDVVTLTVESTDANRPIAYVLAYWNRHGFARGYIDHLVYTPLA